MINRVTWFMGEASETHGIPDPVLDVLHSQIGQGSRAIDVERVTELPGDGRQQLRFFAYVSGENIYKVIYDPNTGKTTPGFLGMYEEEE